MLSTVIFDFDMTLVNSLEIITANLNRIADHFSLRPLVPEEVRPVMSYETPKFWSALWGRYEAEWHEYFNAHCRDLEAGTLKPVDGALELLAGLKRNRRNLALATNRTQPWVALRAAGLASYFDTAVGADSVTAPKPAPDMLLAALKQLGAQPDQAIYVGDAVFDMEAARAAGLKGLGLLSCGVPASDLIRAGAWQVRPTLQDSGDLLN